MTEHNHDTPYIVNGCPRCKEIIEEIHQTLYCISNDSPLLPVGWLEYILTDDGLSEIFQTFIEPYRQELDSLGTIVVSDQLTIVKKRS